MNFIGGITKTRETNDRKVNVKKSRWVAREKERKKVEGTVVANTENVKSGKFANYDNMRKVRSARRRSQVLLD